MNPKNKDVEESKLREVCFCTDSAIIPFDKVNSVHRRRPVVCDEGPYTFYVVHVNNDSYHMTDFDQIHNYERWLVNRKG